MLYFQQGIEHYTFCFVLFFFLIFFLSSFRPVVSERNELLIQFFSDLSLTADGFIGHYKFRPRKLPATTVPPVTTTVPVTAGALFCLELYAETSGVSEFF